MILTAGVALVTTSCSTTTATTDTTSTTATPATTEEEAPAAQGTGSSEVNLNMSSDGGRITPGKTGITTFTISNTGATTRGESVLIYVTPFYVNVSRDQPLPDGCSFLVEEPDPTIPEVVRCTIPAGLEQNKETKLAIPLAVTTRARFVGAAPGAGIVAPAQGSPDKEADLTDNISGGGVSIAPPTPPLPNANIVGVYGTADRPALTLDQGKLVTISYGNVGPNDMTKELAITFLTPFYVNFDRDQPLPEGCGFRLEDPDPIVPEMVTCKRPALAKGEEAQVQFGLVRVPGGPRGAQNGAALVAPATTSDADFDQKDNIVRAGAQIISPVPS